MPHDTTDRRGDAGHPDGRNGSPDLHRQTLDGAWAERSYVHVDRRAMPLALWDLHRVLGVDALAHLALFLPPSTSETRTTPDSGPGGDAVRGLTGAADPEGQDDVHEHGTFPGDDFAGRSFSAWDPHLLDVVLEGSGFGVVDRRIDRDRGRISLTVRRQRTLADTVGPGMRLLLVGLNPSLYAADAGVGFGRPGNRAWPALLKSGLATVDRDPLDLLQRHRVGMTDLVKRATARASELSEVEFRHGFERLDALCAWLQPGAVCVLGVTGWRAATGDPQARLGPQHIVLGGRPVHVMPNPSGLNAHTNVDDLVAHLRAAVDLAAR